MILPFAVQLSVNPAGFSQKGGYRETNLADKRISVAVIPGRGIPPKHVENLLRANKFFFQIEGSLGYDVRVAKEDKARAIKLLKDDEVKHPYHYLSIDGHKGKNGFLSNTLWKKKSFNIALKSIGSAPELKGDINFRGLVYEAKNQYMSQPYVKLKNPYVRQIRFLPMEYLTTDGTWETGYYGFITIRSKVGKKEWEGCAWCWDTGKRRM